MHFLCQALPKNLNPIPAFQRHQSATARAVAATGSLAPGSATGVAGSEVIEVIEVDATRRHVQKKWLEPGDFLLSYLVNLVMSTGSDWTMTIERVSFPWKMVIWQSYARLPEGKNLNSFRQWDTWWFRHDKIRAMKGNEPPCIEFVDVPAPFSFCHLRRSNLSVYCLCSEQLIFFIEKKHAQCCSFPSDIVDIIKTQDRHDRKRHERWNLRSHWGWIALQPLMA